MHDSSKVYELEDFLEIHGPLSIHSNPDIKRDLMGIGMRHEFSY